MQRAQVPSARLESKPPESKPLKSSSPHVFIPEDVGPNDYFRMRRKAGGWIVEMVRVSSAYERKEVYEWDLVDSTERRMVALAMSADRERK